MDAPILQPLSPPKLRRSENSIGLIYGLAAYGFWGFVPVYFKLLSHIQPITILAHRIVWSIVLLLLVLAFKPRWNEIRACVRNRRTLGLLCGSTTAIAINWFTYVWAIGNDRVLDASLGYFINPLVTVLLGVLILGERLRQLQAIASVLAACAVAALVIAERRLPVVAIVLALSFGSYGLLRKEAIVAPMIGLFVETFILFVPALLIVGCQISVRQTDAWTYFLLALSGLVTTVPMICFAAAARRLPLATVGFLQYITPTGQFVLGIFLFHEPIDRIKLGCFVCVWAALAVFIVDAMRQLRHHAKLPPAHQLQSAKVAQA